jgi:predicted RecA/RadA family phage recombinase
MKNNKLEITGFVGLSVLFILFLVTAYLPVHSQYVSEGRVIPLTWTTSAPKSGEVGVKGSATATAMVGVALDGADNVAGTRQMLMEGVFKLPVYARTGASTGSAIVVGDLIYADYADVNTGRVQVLSKDSAGVKVGHALEAAGAATATTSLIRVLIK